jgi:hypothetical protein
MAVVEIVGELLAQSDIRADASVEKIMRMRREQPPKCRRQELKVVEDVAAELQVDSDAPGICIPGPQNHG